MKHFFFNALFCILPAITHAQDIGEYVTKNTTRISNIDTLSSDYSDLESIGAAIGNARIVMLGEQDHGDAPTFLAKTRLIKYLHEKKGFNVLAFESDFYGLNTGWEKTPKVKDSIYNHLKGNIFSIWTSSDACNYLFKEYIPGTFQTSQPLTISGFDSQVSLTYSSVNLKDDFIAYLDAHHLKEKFTGDSSYEKFLIALQDLVSQLRKPDALRLKAEERRTILNNGFALIKDNDSSYWGTIINNLIDYNNNTIETRDKRMALNLKYLANEKYRNEKIIVWAANGHILRYTDQMKSDKEIFKRSISRSMGTDFTNDPQFTNDTYVLGFASYEGTAGRLRMQPYTLAAPEKKGFENWIPEDVKFGFIDFKKYNQEFNAPTKPFLMKAPGHYTIPYSVAKIPWNLVYDGIFFIREMYPVKRIN
ncbi:erythromycin esterase family protein [Chitinophaga sancti]|uniref:erythromycin esterase family protein n=1 Tax=Chitinophaga sancti TaxID=1004 RepID=UPI003F79C7D7